MMVTLSQCLLGSFFCASVVSSISDYQQGNTFSACLMGAAAIVNAVALCCIRNRVHSINRYKQFQAHKPVINDLKAEQALYRRKLIAVSVAQLPADVPLPIELESICVSQPVHVVDQPVRVSPENRDGSKSSPKEEAKLSLGPDENLDSDPDWELVE